MVKMVHSINPGIPLTDLKMRKCRGCEKLMIEVVKDYHFTYCEECFARYSHLMGQYDN